MTNCIFGFLLQKQRGLTVAQVVNASIPLDIAAKVVALLVAWFFVVRKDIKHHTVSETGYLKFNADEEERDKREYCKIAKFAAVSTPVVFLITVVLFITLEIRGGDPTAVLCRIYLILLALYTLMNCNRKFTEGMELITENVCKDFQFGMKVISQYFW